MIPINKVAVIKKVFPGPVTIAYMLIALALLAPMASSTIVPSAPDHVNHLGIIVQAKMGLSEGQFPLRIAPWQHEGMRYPEFQFYAVTPYMFTGLLYKIISPTNPFIAYKAVIWLCLVLSASYMYKTTRYFIKSKAISFISGLIYMTAPYLLINIHARAAFTEVFAQGLLPMVVYFSIRSYIGSFSRFWKSTSLCWFLLATSHIITFLTSSLIVWSLFLALSLKNRKAVKRLLHFSIIYVFGCLLASFFLYPVITADYLKIHVELQNHSPYDSNWLTPIAALLSPTSLPAEPQPGHPTTPNLHPAVGWPILILVCIILYNKVYNQQTRCSLLISILLVLFGAILFVIWSPINFWSILPSKFYVIQFTYRLLTHLMWIGALLSSFAIVSICKKEFDSKHLVVAVLIIGAFCSSYLPTLSSSKAQIKDIVNSPDIGYGSHEFIVSRFTVPEKFHIPSSIPLVYSDRWLILNKQYRVHIDKENQNITLILEGENPAISADIVSLALMINKQMVARKDLPSGKFVWEVPLHHIENTESNFSFEFVASPTFVPAKLDSKSSDQRVLAIRIDRMALVHDAVNYLDAHETRRHTVQKNSVTNVQLGNLVKDTVVQLPVLYYPDLLDVKLNGQSVACFPSIDEVGRPLVGVLVASGHASSFQISFTGSRIANWVSLLCWFIIFAGYTKRFVFSSRKAC